MAAILTIPSGAFSGELTFDIIFDMENYTVELYPSPFTFDIPVLLDLRFTGANLLTSDSAVMEFDYLDGEEDTITYNYMKVDPDRGLLIIEGAQLPHFSRYGWVRTR
jgi:hypothetical protein